MFRKLVVLLVVFSVFFTHSPLYAGEEGEEEASHYTIKIQKLDQEDQTDKQVLQALSALSPEEPAKKGWPYMGGLIGGINVYTLYPFLNVFYGNTFPGYSGIGVVPLLTLPFEGYQMGKRISAPSLLDPIPVSPTKRGAQGLALAGSVGLTGLISYFAWKSDEKMGPFAVLLAVSQVATHFPLLKEWSDTRFRNKTLLTLDEESGTKELRQQEQATLRKFKAKITHATPQQINKISQMLVVEEVGPARTLHMYGLIKGIAANDEDYSLTKTTTLQKFKDWLAGGFSLVMSVGKVAPFAFALDKWIKDLPLWKRILTTGSFIFIGTLIQSYSTYKSLPSSTSSEKEALLDIVTGFEKALDRLMPAALKRVVELRDEEKKEEKVSNKEEGSDSDEEQEVTKSPQASPFRKKGWKTGSAPVTPAKTEHLDFQLYNDDNSSGSDSEE